MKQQACRTHQENPDVVELNPENHPAVTLVGMIKKEVNRSKLSEANFEWIKKNIKERKVVQLD